MKPIRLAGIAIASILVALIQSPSVLADGYVQYAPGPIYRASNSETGRKERADFGVDCYEIYTGRLIDCTVDFKVIGLADKLHDLGFADTGYPELLIEGGHDANEHASPASRPMFYPGGPLLEVFNGVLTTVNPPSQPEIVFDTNAVKSSVVYAVPEFGGLIAVEVNQKTIFPYFCAAFCYDPTDFRTIFTFKVGAWDSTFARGTLVQLPAEGLDYVIDVNPSTGHRDLTLGTDGDKYLNGEQTLGDYMDPNVMPWFLAFAGLYHNDHTLPGGDPIGHRLSVNDASLPLGGLYDYRSTKPWTTPHKGHRDGWAIDLNKQDESKAPAIDCDFNDTVIMESLEVMGGIDPNNSKWEALVCEFNNNENYHLNLRSPME